MVTTSLLLVGCGKMGGALLERWATAFTDYRFDVIEPNLASAHSAKIATHTSLEKLPKDYAPDVIVFAVKPQSLEAMLPEYQKRFGHTPLYISIAAGKTLAFFAHHLGADAKVVRAMPNTPAMVGRGMTGLCAHHSLNVADRKTAEQLLQAAGSVVWIETEALMDAVTAISGSGPAYVFLLMESLMYAGIAAGLPEATARELARQTVYGSGELACFNGEDFVQLRKNVTSPGGTTEAALAVLMKDDALTKLIGEAVQAAKKRSQELAE